MVRSKTQLLCTKWQVPSDVQSSYGLCSYGKAAASAAMVSAKRQSLSLTVEGLHLLGLKLCCFCVSAHSPVESLACTCNWKGDDAKVPCDEAIVLPFLAVAAGFCHEQGFQLQD